MDFAAALKELEAEFGVRSAPEAFTKIGEEEIHSGFIGKRREVEPAVMAENKAVATQLWLQSAQMVLRKHKPQFWSIGEMKMDTWRITIQDAKCTQRIAASRYNAFATISFSKEAETKKALSPADVRLQEQMREGLETVKLAMTLVESGRTVSRDHKRHTAPTGEPFVTMTHAGIKPEGEAFASYEATPADAVRAWQRHMLDYKNANPEGTIYWREEPQIEHHVEVVRVDEGTSSGWRTHGDEFVVVSRVLISNKPAIEEGK